MKMHINNALLGKIERDGEREREREREREKKRKRTKREKKTWRIRCEKYVIIQNFRL